jgi:hypothetical protein
MVHSCHVTTSRKAGKLVLPLGVSSQLSGEAQLPILCIHLVQQVEKEI